MNQPSPFPMIPQQAELNRISRELRFHPVCTSQGDVLGREQIEAFNREGFLAGIRIFSEHEIAEQRRWFDALLGRIMAAGGDSYSISTAHLKYGRVWDLITEPRITAIVKDLLGQNVIGWGAHYFCKMPHDGKIVAWHQDASYWPLTPSKTVTVWLAIDDADRENACMRFLPRSHLGGQLAWHRSENSEENVLEQTVVDVQRFGEPVDIELRAGEISLHSDLLLHGSDANHSDRRRCGLTLRYCTPDVRALMDWNQKGVVVSGTDPTGHWGNPSRPASEGIDP